MTSFPMLTMIDHRNGDWPNGQCLTARLDADVLEARARALAEAYWSNHVWLTGQVTDAEFHAVYDALMATAEIHPVEPKRRHTIIKLVRVVPIPPAFPVRQWVKARLAS